MEFIWRFAIYKELDDGRDDIIWEGFFSSRARARVAAKEMRSRLTSKGWKTYIGKTPIDQDSWEGGFQYVSKSEMW